MISEKKLINYLKKMDEIAIEFLNSTKEEEFKKCYQRYIDYFKNCKLGDIDEVFNKYPGFFNYGEKIRILMYERMISDLCNFICNKDIEQIDIIIANHYQKDINSRNFTKKVIDDLPEKEFFDYMDRLYFLKNFYELYNKQDELNKTNLLFKDFSNNKKYGKRYVLDDYLMENYPETYALILSIRSDLNSANLTSQEVLRKMKKGATIERIKILDNDIKFLKKNKNHYLLFKNDLMEESLFRMFCQEYIERTGILEKDITWFNKVLSKGYALLSMY